MKFTLYLVSLFQDHGLLLPAGGTGLHYRAIITDLLVEIRLAGVLYGFGYEGRQCRGEDGHRFVDERDVSRMVHVGMRQQYAVHPINVPGIGEMPPDLRQVEVAAVEAPERWQQPHGERVDQPCPATGLQIFLVKQLVPSVGKAKVQQQPPVVFFQQYLVSADLVDAAVYGKLSHLNLLCKQHGPTGLSVLISVYTSGLFQNKIGTEQIGSSKTSYRNRSSRLEEQEQAGDEEEDI